MKSFNGPKTQNEVQNDDKLMWESFVSREADDSTDHHNQYMMDQDLLQPLHKAAQATGADDIVDYMIKQIKAQGENWTNWFIDTVIGDEEDYDESTNVQEGAFDHVSGDPSTYKVGEIIPADVSQDDYDGIIVSIDEEDEERVFNLMQVGPEGWSVPEANLNLPDDDTGRIPQDVDTFGMKLPRN